jgi:nucleoside-diphosphate-sugar epimerase
MRLFITGANGFIGSRVRTLAELSGHEVMCLAPPHRMASAPLDRIADFQPDACIHCAWIATPGVYQESPENADHVAWSVSLVKGLLHSGTRRFVVLGSCAEYLPARRPLSENYPLVVSGSPYATAKVRLHSELRKLQESHPFTLAWARIFFPFGAGEHPGRLFSLVARACRERGYDPAMIRHPAAIRDYIHVEDVASAILLLSERAANGPYNVGSGRGVAVGEAAAKLAQMLGVDPHEGSGSPDAGLEDMVVSDSSRLMAFGWRPKHDLEAGFSDYLDHTRGGPCST